MARQIETFALFRPRKAIGLDARAQAQMPSASMSTHVSPSASMAMSVWRTWAWTLTQANREQ
eukprot:10804337-Lingulodinium_polyedra.AAC.1